MRASSPAVRLVLACLLVAGTASGCQEDAPPPPVDLIDYVAIGDSHTAAPHTPEGDLTMPCARSDTNYPTELKELLGRTILTDVSCTGARTEAVIEGWDWRDIPMPPQLDALSVDTDLVTVNIGGNDERLFEKWFAQCKLVAPLDPEGSPCADGSKTRDGDRLLDLVPQIQQNVSKVLAEIEDRAPNAAVVVVTYPRAFPDRDTCRLAAAFATGDHAYINSIIKAVSDALIGAAEDAGVGWVDVYEASRGHDICSETPWVNGVTTDWTRANELHPFPEEQAAVAQMIFEKINR
jgi:lysophospholipase L1-like esterase